jgi:Acyl-CoA carboxylase epsilon subunit
MTTGPDRPTAEEEAAVLAVLRHRLVQRPPADSEPEGVMAALAAWRRRRQRALGQTPRRPGPTA